MSNRRPYFQVPVFGKTVNGSFVGEEIAATTTRNVDGFGHFGQINGLLVVTGVTGGADTLDAKLQYLVEGTAVDVTGMSWTQVTAAQTGEVKVAIRTAAVTWTDDINVVVTMGAGATATGVKLVLWGARP